MEASILTVPSGDRPPLPVPPIPQLPLISAQDYVRATSGGNTESCVEAPRTPVSPVGASPEKIAEAYEAFITRYYDDPVGYVEEVLGGRPKKWQKIFLRKIAAGVRRISVRAGHGVGKSTACAWAVSWFKTTRFPQKTVITAPTAAQLFDALFSEIKSWEAKLPPSVRELFEVFSEHIQHRSAPDDSFVSARTSSSERPEAMSGVHSAHVLLICDEASAIPESVYESATGSMSSHSCTMILISNPTRNSGLFFKTHHALRGSWETMAVSCLDPDLADMVSPDFAKQIAETYGENSNAYRVRVLGEFPEREDDVLIAAELVDAAMIRDVFHDVTQPLRYGVDVARFGDDRSALCKRQGNVVPEPIKTWHGNDLMATVGRIVAETKLDRPHNPKEIEICVDTIGVGGGVADRLRELGYNVRDVNVSESSPMREDAAKLRDECWLAVRDWLNTRATKLPKDDELRQELCSPTYAFLSNGKTKVESKQELKKRGLRSPDKADSLCLTFAGEAAVVGGRAARWIPGKPLKRNVRGVV